VISKVWEFVNRKACVQNHCLATAVARYRILPWIAAARRFPPALPTASLTTSAFFRSLANDNSYRVHRAGNYRLSFGANRKKSDDENREHY